MRLRKRDAQATKRLEEAKTSVPNPIRLMMGRKPAGGISHRTFPTAENTFTKLETAGNARQGRKGKRLGVVKTKLHCSEISRSLPYAPQFYPGPLERTCVQAR
ncbi:hypothetical protein CSOJ01_11644 [Colletotrichum sojae]|uniref:Uncharacterized protein n=1 Tax=Colletotrichum sojae TaxID=2175907 RepID=A0A8H6IXN6_9PEZI|nr:hypothetical protein CSOJ01_11644 [Colletotrichum sojae]